MATEVNVTEKTPAKAKSPDSSTSNNGKYIQIPLPNHSLFAVFDGHGGSFAAEYASRNLLRVLCRSNTFCEYAEKWRGREDYFTGLKAASGEMMMTKQQTRRLPQNWTTNNSYKNGDVIAMKKRSKSRSRYENISMMAKLSTLPAQQLLPTLPTIAMPSSHEPPTITS